MKLKQYIAQKKLRPVVAAAELGVSYEAFRLWLKGNRIPQPEKMILIYRWSQRAVQPNDFYDLSDPGPLEGLPLFGAGAGKPNGNHVTSEGT